MRKKSHRKKRLYPSRAFLLSLFAFLVFGVAAWPVFRASADAAPSVLPIPDTVIEEDDYLYLTVTAEDPDCGYSGPDDYSCPNDTLSFSSSGLPLGALLKDVTDDLGNPLPNNARQARIIWLPLPDQAGQDFSVSISVTDAAGHVSATESVLLTATDLTGPPVVTAPAARQVIAGEPLAFVVAAQDHDYPAESITLTASNLPAGASFQDYGTGVGLFRWVTSPSDSGTSIEVSFRASSGTDLVTNTTTVTVQSVPNYTEISSCGDVYTNVRIIAPLTKTNGQTCLNVKASNIIIDGNHQPITVTYGAEDQALEIRDDSNTPFNYSNITIKNIVSEDGIRLVGDTMSNITIHSVQVGALSNSGTDDIAYLNNTLSTFLSSTANVNGQAAVRAVFADNVVQSDVNNDVKSLVEFIGSYRDVFAPITNYVIEGNTITGTFNGTPTSAITTMRIRESRHNVVSRNTVVSTGTRMGLYIRDESNDTLYESNRFESEGAEAIRVASGNDCRTWASGNIFRGNTFISRADPALGRNGIYLEYQIANTYDHNVFWLPTTNQTKVFGGFRDVYDHNTFYFGSNYLWQYRSGPPADVYTNNIFSYSAGQFFTTTGFALNRYTGDYNLFFNRSGDVQFSPPTHTTLADWQQDHLNAGAPQDVHSLEADPLFVDPANGDFRLQPGSPAIGHAADGSELGALSAGSNAVPVLQAIGSRSVHLGESFSFFIAATDSDAEDELLFSAIDLPNGATLTNLGNRTAMVQWTPTSGQIGDYSVQFRVADTQGGADSEVVTLTVLENAPPCVSNWTCTEWSSCSGGLQTRTCTDEAACGSDAGRPAEAQACDGTPPASVADLRVQ